VPERRVRGGVRRQPRQQRSLRQQQLRARLAEEPLRRGFHAVRPLAEVDPVEVEAEDLLLREGTLQPDGEDGLADLPLHGLRVAQERVARELLADGARSLPDVPGRHIGEERARHARQVDAPVLEEAPVLRREHGLPDNLGDLGQRERHPVLDEELPGQLPIPVVEERLAGRLDLARALRRWEVAAPHREEAVDGPGHGERNEDYQGDQYDAWAHERTSARTGYRVKGRRGRDSEPGARGRPRASGSGWLFGSGRGRVAISVCMTVTCSSRSSNVKRRKNAVDALGPAEVL